MLAYMKMGKSEDRGPWFLPLRHSDLSTCESKFLRQPELESPDVSIEMNSNEDSPELSLDGDDGPLCLVVDKKPNSKNFLPTPPVSNLLVSPPEVRFSSPHQGLASPLRVDVQQQGLSISPVTSSFQDHERQNFFGALPMLSPADFIDSPIFARALASGAPKRPRGEKKPIPEEQKDNKYFERRKRNNLAAKKSRDARKSREDQIALRATTLEKENAVLRAQVLTLREEAESLRHLLIQKRNR